MSAAGPCFLGLDLGTGGVRGLVVDAAGVIVAESRVELAREQTADPGRAGWSEQDPADWEVALWAALDGLVSRLDAPEDVVALAVDSTSGTVLAMDGASGEVRSPALLYNDRRAGAEALQCSEVLGSAISATFGLPKILWLLRHADLPAGVRFVHAADYLNELLVGRPVATDFTNAMKSGVDLEVLAWPEEIERLGLSRGQLPEICRPAEELGLVAGPVAERLGLRPGTRVFAGATDSNAAFYGSGAGEVGEWCNTIGTTFALKGIASSRLHDPRGRLYCHRHPDLAWLPGGASNCGGEVLKHYFGGEDLAALDHAARERGTTEHLVFPLVRTGERLPFVGDEIEGFVLGDRDDRVGFYLGCLEGVAFVERLVLEVLAELGAPVGGVIHATGGGAKSATWLQVRADILQRELRVPACPESAFGAAVLAAAGHLGQSVGATSRQLVQIVDTHRPTADAERRDYYEKKYARFREECRQRGYE